MRVIVDQANCTGHARCQECCPEVFGTDDLLGKVVVLLDVLPEALHARARLAVRNCPEGAITLSEGNNPVEEDNK